MNRDQARDAVIAAASFAIAPEAMAQFPGFSDKQRPLIPLFLALLDATQSIAAAIADNAWDDQEPINVEFALGCKRQALRIGSDIYNATESPNHAHWEIKL